MNEKVREGGYKIFKNMKTELERLRKQFHAANTDAEREAVKAEMQRFLDVDPEAFATSMLSIGKDIVAETDEFLIKAKLNDVSKMVSMSYIAKEYFNKSRSWLHQRINGYLVNGKQATFTKDERETLNRAFKELGEKLGSVSV